MTNDAKTSYKNNLNKARALMAQISQAVEAHSQLANGHANWSHVGDMAYVVDELKDIAAFLADGE